MMGGFVRRHTQLRLKPDPSRWLEHKAHLCLGQHLHWGNALFVAWGRAGVAS